jgi:hypothetical protein
MYFIIFHLLTGGVWAWPHLVATFAQVQWWLNSGTFVAYGDLVAFGYGMHFGGGLSDGANGRNSKALKGFPLKIKCVT